MKKIFYLFLAVCLAPALCACLGTEKKPSAAVDNQQAEHFYDVTNETVGNEGNKHKKITVSTGNPMEQPAKMKGVQEVILKRKGYIVSYNPQTKIPNWVAWHLTAAHTKGSVRRKDEMFHEDNESPMPRVTDADYYNSGFDRGHMCPAGDNQWYNKAMNQTFLFTNICPQVHAFNVGAWNDLEIACRRWAQKYGDLYIVCGPLLNDGPHRTIGKHKVVVPERFFKVILTMHEKPKAIGFLYDNSSRNPRSMFKNATNVDEVERQTGIDFFPNLRDVIENEIEADRGYF